MHTDENTLCTLKLWGFVNALQEKYVPKKGHENFWMKKWKFLFFLEKVIGKFGSKNFT